LLWYIEFIVWRPDWIELTPEDDCIWSSISLERVVFEEVVYDTTSVSLPPELFRDVEVYDTDGRIDICHEAESNESYVDSIYIDIHSTCIIESKV
jgi:hypothetical protein